MLTDTADPRYDGACPVTTSHHDRGAAMSFGLFFQPCRSGTEPVERKNPFTGEVQTSVPVESLSAEDVLAIRGVLTFVGRSLMLRGI
jgi:hypothetical protein